jgi:hypothetical protein
MSTDHPPAERPILTKIENGLKLAVEDDPDLDWTEDGTRIRRQKYTEQAVSYFTQSDEDAVLTSSWYKFGKTYPAAPSGTNIWDGYFRSPEIQQSEIFAASLEEIIHFFTHEADQPKLNAKYWFLPTLDFLENFYNYHAPERYKNLYLENVELRRVFADTSHEINSLRRNQSSSATSLSDFGGGQTVDYYKRVGRTAARIQMELATTVELKESLNPFREFTDLVEDVFMKLAEIEQSNLTAHHQRVIDSLEEFYNDTAWEYPAAIVMLHTAEGPNRSWVIDQAEQRLDTLRKTYEAELEHQRRLCAEAGLLPSASDYPGSDDDVESAISNHMRTVDRMNE